MADNLVDMSGQFSGLPMEDLIGGPLLAACDAQVKLAKSTANFIAEIGLVTTGEGEAAVTKTRQVDFSFKRPVAQPSGEVLQEEVSLSAPMLAIVPIPSLRIEEVSADFEMEVKSSFQQKQSADMSGGFEAKVGWGPFSVKVHGSVAAHSESTRSSDNSAKYTVHCLAKQAPPPEGLMKILDILQTACEPVATKQIEPAAA